MTWIRIRGWGFATMCCMASAWACTSDDADSTPSADVGPAADGAAPVVDGPDHELIAYLSTEFGFRMTQVAGAFEETMDAEGRWVERDRLRIELAGHGVHVVEMEETFFSLAEGGGIGLVLRDLETGADRGFTWDIEGNYISMDRVAPDGQVEGATVSVAPDGTYTVVVHDAAGERVAEETSDGRRAFEAVEAQTHYRDAPHILMTAFALAHTPAPESRIQVSCADTAPAPPICSVYTRFCTCAPCLALQDPAICQRHCPEQ